MKLPSRSVFFSDSKNMKSLAKNITFVFLIGLMAMQPIAVLNAQGFVTCGTRTDQDIQGTAAREDFCSIRELIQLVYSVINFLLSISGLIAVAYILWGGLQMILAQGSQERLTKAKATLWNAILGFVLILLSYLIVGFVAGLLLGSNATANPMEYLQNFF